MESLGGGFLFVPANEAVAWLYGESHDLGRATIEDIQEALKSDEDFKYLDGKEVRYSDASALSSLDYCYYDVMTVKTD